MRSGGLRLPVAQGLSFLAWAATMFLTLFQLRAATARRHGGSLFNIGNTFRGFRDFLTAGEWRERRWLLLATTLAMVAAIALGAVRPFQPGG